MPTECNRKPEANAPAVLARREPLRHAVARRLGFASAVGAGAGILAGAAIGGLGAPALGVAAAGVLAGGAVGGGLSRMLMDPSALPRPRRAPQPPLLTFDDGPGDATLPIADELRRLGQRAVFFVLGSQIRGREAMVRELENRGHLLAVHGWDHVTAPVFAEPEFEQREIRRCLAALRAAGVRQRVRYWRPPHGFRSLHTGRAARVCGLRLMGWTHLLRDWEADAREEVVLQRLSDALVPGAIVLLHDGGPNPWVTYRALSRLKLAAS